MCWDEPNLEVSLYKLTGYVIFRMLLLVSVAVSDPYSLLYLFSYSKFKYSTYGYSFSTVMYCISQVNTSCASDSGHT